MQYFAIIDETIFPLYNWNAMSFRNSQQLHLATDNLVDVREAVTNFHILTVKDENDNIIAEFTEFDGYSSITYVGRGYSSLLNTFTDELVVTLTKVDLVEQVQRLEEKVNPIVDPTTMTLEELKEYKIKQFSQQGEQIIFAGTNVTLTDGTVKNFTYNLEDQCNLLNALFIIGQMDDLTVTLPYHGHGEPCELYGALDIMLVYMTLQFFSVNVQTQVNMLNSWVRDCQTREEVEAITFDSVLPTQYMEHIAEIMEPTMELAEQIRQKYFPNLNTINDGAIEQEPSEEIDNEGE